MPDTYYLPGQVHPDDDALSATHLNATRKMRLADVRRISALPIPSLLVEVGLVLQDAAGNRIWLRETDAHFHWLTRRIAADALLGANWYARAENGERIEAAARPQAVAPKPAK